MVEALIPLDSRVATAPSCAFAIGMIAGAAFGLVPIAISLARA